MNNEKEKTLLLVEDEAFIAMPEMLTLREHGYKVITVFSGEKAIEIVEKFPEIDLVLMDLNLGKGMDGIQSANQILKKRMLPIIFLLSPADRQLYEKTENITSYGYIVKGSEERVFLTSIKKALRLFESRLMERQKEEALRQSDEEYRNIFQTALDGFWRVNKEGRLLEVNDTYCRMSGYSAQELLALSIPDLEGSESTDGIAAYIRKGVRQVEDRFESKHIRKDGSIFDVEVSIQSRSFDGGQYIAFLRDITNSKKAEEALKTLSFRDELTGLYNRRGFFTLAEQGLKTAQRLGKEMLLIFGDLDNMKEINDRFGHKEGDQALVDISHILKETFRESDIIARIGGDEFVILAMNSLETLNEKLINRFEQVRDDYHLQTKRSHKLSMSFGIARFDPQNPCSINALLSQADKLMYENKDKKGN